MTQAALEAYILDVYGTANDENPNRHESLPAK